MPFWKRREEPGVRRGLRQAMLHGAGHERLIEAALAELAAEREADRFGVWLDTSVQQASGTDTSFHGLVWDRENEDTPREWRALAPRAVLSSARLVAGTEIETILNNKSTDLVVGPVVGLQKVLWVPVEHAGKLRGILMAGATTAQRILPKEKLKQMATELAIALALESERRLANERRADIAVCNKILTSLEEGAAPAMLLQDIVDSCVGVTGKTENPGAVAAAVAAVEETIAAGNRELTILCAAGEPVAQQALKREAAKDLARQVLENQRTMGREVELSGSDQMRLRVVAVPLVAKEGAPAKVLLAAFSQGAASLSALERVELRGKLATVVLSTEGRRAAGASHEEALKSLLEVSRDAIVVLNALGEPSVSNRAARTILLAKPGVEKRNFDLEDKALPAGRKFSNYFRARHRENVEEWQRTRRKRPGHEGRTSPEFELESGARVWLHVREFALRRAAITLVPSKTARVDEDTRAQAELLGLSEWLDQGVVVYDGQENIRLMNLRFAQLAGLSPDEVDQYKTLDSLITRLRQYSADPEAFSRRWLDLAKHLDGGEREEVHLVRPGPRTLERASRPVLDAQGGRLGRIELYRDLTAQRVFQAQLLQTERLAALGQMVTGVAHELSNPLTSILGYAQRLLLRNDAEGNFEELRKIFSEAERAGAILRRMLLAARETTPERRPVSLNQLVQRTIELQRFSLAAERIRVEVSLDAQLPNVLGDAGQLQQVLINLIGNSRQAIESRSNGGTIRVRTRHTEDNRVQLEISDSGPGIPESIMARIFDPFFTTKPAGVGTGLGLAIVLSLVREHGGQVHVASPKGSGAIFTIELPAAERGEPGVAETVRTRNLPALLSNEMRTAPATGRDAATQRVLVVEDEPTVAQLIADVLRDEGFEVETLLDGQDAPDKILRGTFDLIVCDMKMPNLDGQSLYESLAPARKAVQARFLFVTGDVLGAKTQAFLTRTGVPHVAKPFRVEELLEKVHQVLQPAGSSGARRASPLRKNTATTG